MAEIGEKAPSFTLPRDAGGEVSLSGYAGQNVVLFFYPKDNTPGCTKEAIDFTTDQPAFEAANTVVIGLSKDSVKKHDNFVAKHDLGVILASDADSDVCEQYGVWKEKSMYGKKFLGIERSTFLIDAEGKLAHIWPKVRVKGHVDAVLEAARALS
mgnify:CR=1 FL=1